MTKKEIRLKLSEMKLKILDESLTDTELKMLKDRIELYEQFDKHTGLRLTSTIDINSVLGLVGTLTSILLVMNHERANVITTKAFSFIPKIGKK